METQKDKVNFMKILITGSNGQLGNALTSLLQNDNNSIGKLPAVYKNCEIVAVDVDKLDITDTDAVLKFVTDNKPDIIINCAAMTNVDGCEDNLELAEKINALGPENLAKAAESVGSKIIHVSTDYVFHGDATVPYVETDKCDPVTAYGISKYHGEQKVAAACKKHFVVRTSWLYGYLGNNFVKTIRRIAKEKGVLNVVNDQRGNPTNANDLAYHLLLIGDTENYGIYHCTGSGECTWYDFACRIVEYSNIPCSVSPCSTEQSARKAKRPAFSSLRNLHLEETVGDKMRDWEVALKEYIVNLDKMEQTV
jgi:dTDP-4-dehydrorhamnose reductase